jgi:dihydroflavonol-4-reductase
MKVFITGITGLLGNNVARLLTKRGDEVVALVRSEPNPEVLDGIRVKLVRGELKDAPETDAAIRECDAVIHSAALIHLGWTRTEESMQINRDGTIAIADMALRHRKRFVHIGTVNTIPVATDGVPSDEETPTTEVNAQVPCDYVVSKRASVEVVMDRVAKGLDAVIVHPGFMLGPYDWKPSSGRMMLELGKGFKPGWPVGGCSVCDVRDVAAGVIAALDRGQTGRHYVLAGENVTYKVLWTEMMERMGRPKPLVPIGPMLRAVAGRVGDLSARITGHETDINSAGVKMSSQLHWHSSDRARAELGYTTRSRQETLDDCAKWIRDRFLSKR